MGKSGARPPKQPLKRAVGARLAGESCPRPPHGDHSVTRGRRFAPESAAAGLARWVKAKPAERGPLPIGIGLYGAGGLAHLADLPAIGVLPVGAGAAMAAYGAGLKRWGDEARAAKLAAAVGAGSSWLAAAAELGLTWGPYGAFSWAYWTLFGGAYVVYRLDAGTRQAVERRKEKTEWHRTAAKLGLKGAHLLKQEPTRLGETLTVDVTGTRSRATRLAGGDLAERIAEQHRLPASRVFVTPDRIAGRLRINIRHRDPWAQPVPHPLLDTDPELKLPAKATATRPLVVGIDPETGRPLELEVWTEDGAKHTMIIAMLGSGKTVFLNDLLERLTAAEDACVWGIDVRKGKDLRQWGDALDLTALGPGERAKAVNILYLARKAVEERAATNQGRVFRPSPGHPLITVVIDEMSALFGTQDRIGMAARDHTRVIATAGRSEGVNLVLVGQRGTVDQIGSTDIRTQIENYVMLRLSRRTEMAHVAGELGLELPDMARYGEGHKGVVLIAGVDGGHTAGRGFKLADFPDIRRLATGRRPSPLEPELLERLGGAYQKLKQPTPARATSAAPTGEARDPGGEAWMTELDNDLEATLPPDLRAEIGDRMRDAADARTQINRYLDSVDIPKPSAELASRLRDASAVRRDQQAEQTQIPAEARARLEDVLRAGAALRDITEALGISRATAWRYLNRLRFEGVAAPHGSGRGTQWRLTGGDGA